jgi:hypothetical protein
MGFIKITVRTIYGIFIMKCACGIGEWATLGRHFCGAKTSSNDAKVQLKARLFAEKGPIKLR